MDPEIGFVRILKDVISSMLVVLDCDGNIIDSNDNFEIYLISTFGRDYALKKRNISDYVAEIELRILFEIDTDSLSSKNKKIEVPLINGQMIYFLCYEIKNNDKKEFLLISVEDKVFAEDIIDSLPGSIYWKDLDGRYIGTNKAVLEMAGLTDKSEIIGKTDYDLCWREFAQEWLDIDNEVMTTGQQMIREENVRLHNGNLMTELTYKSPLKNRNGKIVGIIGASLDITDLKETQKNLQEALEQSRVAQKTKDAILANFGHDFRTPFSGLLGWLELIAEEEPNPEKKENLSMIHAGSEPLLAQLNGFIELLKSVDGKLPILNKVMNCYDVLHTLVDMYKPAISEKEIDLTVNANKDDWDTAQHGDVDRITKILVDVISNAVKFTPKGGQILLRLCREDLNDGNLIAKFFVKDTGGGISPDHEGRIFEPFYKARPSYNCSDLTDSGAGVGLAIAKQYVDDIGAQLDFQTVEGEGTVFVFAVPLKQSLVSTNDLKYKG